MTIKDIRDVDFSQTLRRSIAIIKLKFVYFFILENKNCKLKIFIRKITNTTIFVTFNRNKSKPAVQLEQQTLSHFFPLCFYFSYINGEVNCPQYGNAFTITKNINNTFVTNLKLEF